MQTAANNISLHRPNEGTLQLVYKMGELFVYVAVAILSSYRMRNKSVHTLKQGTRDLSSRWRRTGEPHTYLGNIECCVAHHSTQS
jgi:hypothetical protein